jgi:hypothetical protein
MSNNNNNNVSPKKSLNPSIIVALFGFIGVLVVTIISITVDKFSNQYQTQYPTDQLPLIIPTNTMPPGDPTSIYQSEPTPTPAPTYTSIAPLTPSISVLPDFPWPPPKPSAGAHISFNKLNKFATFGDINKIISSALDSGEYDERSYFNVPNGFAIVTRLEQIDPYG